MKIKKLTAALLTVIILAGVFILPVNAKDSNLPENPTVRDTIILLDSSGSMSGTPNRVMKRAAIKFCQSVLNAEGINRVAVISYSNSAQNRVDFTYDIDVLEREINKIGGYGGTNIHSAYEAAVQMMQDKAEPNAVKNIVLLTDGLPEHGEESAEGKYSYSDHPSCYKQGNAVYNFFSQYKDDYYFYTLGFYHALRGQNLTFAQMFLNDIQNAGYYEVEDPEKLDFAFGEVADDIASARFGFFNYASGEERDYDSKYFYNDNYFKDSARNYNQSLCTMSLCLAMSAFASNETDDYSDKSRNVKKLLTDTDFKDFDVNDGYKTKPTTDSIGAAAANKKITINGVDYTLLAVAMRGDGYKAEWASNFTIGETGQHQGFDEAKEQVIAFLKEYIANKNIQGRVKLWITGYSRAAATANLVAGELDGDTSLLSDKIDLQPQDIYAYCFETPAGALKAEVEDKDEYDNIFNILNRNDPVPKVAPVQMGFLRYGVDKFIVDQVTDNNYFVFKEKMLEKYNELDSTDNYVVDDFQMKKLNFGIINTGNSHTMNVTKIPEISIDNDTEDHTTQGAYIDDLIDKLVKENIKTRTNYVNEYQDDIRQICKVVFGTEKGQWKVFVSKLSEKAAQNIGMLLLSTNILLQPYTGTTSDLLKSYAIESLGEAGITDYDEREIDSLVASLAKLTVSFSLNHPSMLATAICNIEGLGAAHYPELCLAWMQSMDSNYSSELAQFGTGSYRIVRINCPVDVEVYNDKSGELAAKIVSDIPQKIEGSSIISAINEDGEKVVYLPVDCSYSIKLIPTAKGVLNYSVNEYNSGAGEINRVVNYYDIPIDSGKLLAAYIPQYSEEDISSGSANGTNLEYTLYNADNEIITPDVTLNGKDATEAYYMVYVSSENDNYGMVTGQGVRQLGNFAKVSAIPNNGYKFDGWYDEENNCISKDADYRFCVKEEVSLIAKFVPDPTQKPTEESTQKNIAVNAGTNSSGSGTEKTSMKSPKTGDSSNLLLIELSVIMLMLIIIIASKKVFAKGSKAVK